LVEKETGKGLDAAAIWSAGLSAFSASGLSSADSDYVWQKLNLQQRRVVIPSRRSLTGYLLLPF
jgi:hypothetical protein